MKSPEGWRIKSLRQLATINYGRSPGGILSDDGHYLVVGTGGDDRLGNAYLHDGESIILGRKGSIDRIRFVSGKFWTIDTAYYLTDFTDVFPKWLFYLLETIDLRQLNEATGVPSLSRDLLYKIQVNTPPEREQVKIAEIVAIVDGAIKHSEALIAKRKLIKTGLMQDLLTGGIDEHGRLRSEQTHKFKDSSLGRIPEEWWIASVGELFERRIERGRPGLPVMSIVMNDGLVKRSSVDRRVESNLPDEGHALVRQGDIAYNMMRMWQGVLGRATFDCLVSPAYVVLKPRNSIDSCFAEWLFRDERFPRSSPKRKKLTITVERDRAIIIHVPEGVSDDEAHRVVEAKRQWLLEKLKHPQKYQARPHPPGKEVVNGESAPYLGRDYQIEIAETKSGQVEFSGRFTVPTAHQVNRREVLKDWYIARANERILPRVHQQARTLGLAFTSARIVDNRYRWGSCTVRDTVNFNWRLIKAPIFVIDYVIVHELAHLLETNHTPRFWSIIRAHTPTMEKAKEWLKEHGQVLEEEV